ncbi:flagellar basal-body MS-ring/collar protein FliF [Sulfuriferula nivalis]|uniref:Flagellar M-ring protein n=1 Tax=Sulfuriferula nivalis TaxID=2675298 RepID=A0A809SHY7_9PROT|nr:flagellar basal-body MS-ring/collar protein FliF [Sulfuriferula nivalis]BBP01210.1 flagellar M-ring protein [Sulfuriferula nivalis]
MAAEGEIVATPGFANFATSSIGRKLFLMVGIAAVIAVMAGVWMWSQKPDYRVLFSNFSDKDGGSIVAALEQMNVQYKYAEGGGAILVPADQVHDLRLKLASQGLPKGGNVGFELMENQKLGTSQFLEQVNFQRAIEGELAQTIEAVNAVQSARVHLALPKASVFVRDQQKPTASILLNLQPGRALDVGQVSAIVHLVASSVPDLTPSNVTIVDQNGNLLSDSSTKLSTNGMDPNQLKYVQALQDDVAKRIESIVAPIVGAANVHAEVTADVDFSHSEQAAESYKPNQTPDSATVRSTQTSESSNGSGNASGIPGAATNQPPAPATAPITAPPSAIAAAAAAANTAASSSTAAPATTQKDATINYEVDKTIRYVQQPMGGLKRLSVAVVVNYKQTTDKAGKVKNVPLTSAEQAQISDLVKEAMGYSQARGDTLNIVNSQFLVNKEEAIPETPIWKQPDNINMAKEMGKYLLAFIAILYLYKKVLKPLIEKFNEPARRHHTNAQGEDMEDDEDGSEVHLSSAAHTPPPGSSYQSHLENAKQMAKENPKVVASVVKVWVNGNE